MTQEHRIAARLESVWNARGLNVTKLAASTGIADKTLRRRLVQPGQFTVHELSTICRVLEVDVADVLNLNKDVESIVRGVAA